MNSSPSKTPMEDYVRRALELLRAEFPEAYGQICTHLAGRSFALAIEEERMFLEIHRFELEFVPALSAPNIQAETDCATILDVIDAKVTLDAAVRLGRLQVMGSQGDLSASNDALLCFVRGGVRSPSFPSLLAEFRWTASQGSKIGSGRR